MLEVVGYDILDIDRGTRWKCLGLALFRGGPRTCRFCSQITNLCISRILEHSIICSRERRGNGAPIPIFISFYLDSKSSETGNATSSYVWNIRDFNPFHSYFIFLPLFFRIFLFNFSLEKFYHSPPFLSHNPPLRPHQSRITFKNNYSS